MSDPIDTPELSSGLLLGDTYRILRKIGAGGMATVYQVEHVRIGRRKPQG